VADNGGIQLDAGVYVEYGRTSRSPTVGTLLPGICSAQLSGGGEVGCMVDGM
jgi:hypothetical protein